MTEKTVANPAFDVSTRARRGIYEKTFVAEDLGDLFADEYHPEKNPSVSFLDNQLRA